MTDQINKEISIRADAVQREALIALLGDLGYDGFWETDEALLAYISARSFDYAQLPPILAVTGCDPKDLELREIAPQNWNESWEAQYPPVRIGSLCQIITHFHEELDGFRYTLRITPKMSFGTGHHQTTRLMIQAMATLPLPDTSVLDMGCGTGVLAILAKKMGATDVVAIDIDRWSYENASENILLNAADPIEVRRGDVTALTGPPFDIILANINRNVLLQDMAAYASHLHPDGLLLISGFHPEDQELLLAEAKNAGLEPQQSWAEERWMALLLKRNETS